MNAAGNNLTLKINEIFYSIQGESSYVGLPCVFVRLTYCNLHCNYCDTEYAFFEGKDMSFQEIIKKVKSYNCNLVEITGGEPLIQDNVIPFMKLLCDQGCQVLIETAGHIDIGKIDPRVVRIMDIKCPSSGVSEKNHWENISELKDKDEVKFVIGSRDDYKWTKEVLKKYNLSERCTVLMSPVFNNIKLSDLAEWILADQLNVRFQPQIQKFIWRVDKRGV
ncbi:MAG: radical SAM protein [Calditrichales bacterium]|nr:radical SAM protein [Calditrichales bacterium]